MLESTGLLGGENKGEKEKSKKKQLTGYGSVLDHDSSRNQKLNK